MLSSRPVGVASYFPHMDKVAHALAFGALMALTAWGLSRSWPAWGPARVHTVALAITVVYGLLDEFHQYFVPSRSSDPLDLVADAAGALLVLAWLRWWTPRGGAR